MRRIVCFLLAILCALSLFAGCSEVADIAGNVVTAAKEELENQIRAKIEEYKVEIVETKSVFGKLNDDGGKYQFYYAIVVQTNTGSVAQDCAAAVGKIAGRAGCIAQTGSAVESSDLVHKSISYDHTDFSEGNYYTVYVYVADLTKIASQNTDATTET